jgi:hypothetical protein
LYFYRVSVTEKSASSKVWSKQIQIDAPYYDTKEVIWLLF